jgi:hypothetical protein
MPQKASQETGISSKMKLIFGIIVPILIVILLAIMSNTGKGIEVKESYVSNINFKEYANQPINENSNFKIEVYNITVKNSNFIPRKYEIPQIYACAVDKENANYAVNIPVVYSEGKYNRLNGFYEFDQAFFGISNNWNQRSIEMPTNSQKIIKMSLDIYVYSQQDYQTNTYYKTYAGIKNIQDYDEVVLVKSPNSYFNCYDNSNLANLESKHIPLVK